MLFKQLLKFATLVAMTAVTTGCTSDTEGYKGRSSVAKPKVAPEPAPESAAPKSDDSTVQTKETKTTTIKAPEQVAQTKSTPEPTTPGVPPNSPITLNITFKQWRGEASFRNCLAFAVNGGQMIQLGCNQDGDLTRTISVPAISKPAINKITLAFTTNNVSRPNQIQVFKEGNTFKIGYEDGGGDDDFNDYVVSITSPGGVNLAIEGCDTTQCKME